MDNTGKRVNFVSVQQSHTIATNEYKQPVVKTGYEYVIANRTSDMFAYSAKDDGVIKSITAKGIIIEYKDKTIKGLPLGRLYGKAEGSVYPHDIVTNYKVGDKVKKGDVVTFNKNFFEQDYIDSSKIVLKNSMIVKTALLESSQTFEDSSSISRKLSDKLRAKTTKVKSITVNFNQRLNNVVSVGSKVMPKDVLLIIEDELTSNTDDFNEESLATLKKLSNQAPLAKYEGVIDRIEVFYHGDKEDMGNSLRVLADASDKILIQECKSTNRPIITGQVTDEYRVSGIPLGIDKAEIKIYITVETKAAVGDKGVFANQMKSVFGEVMDYSVITETGEEIDAIFGFKSILNRIVTSPFMIGTTTTLLDIIGKQAVKLYER